MSKQIIPYEPAELAQSDPASNAREAITLTIDEQVEGTYRKMSEITLQAAELESVRTTAIQTVDDKLPDGKEDFSRQEYALAQYGYTHSVFNDIRLGRKVDVWRRDNEEDGTVDLVLKQGDRVTYVATTPDEVDQMAISASSHNYCGELSEVRIFLDQLSRRKGRATLGLCIGAGIGTLMMHGMFYVMPEIAPYVIETPEIVARISASANFDAFVVMMDSISAAVLSGLGVIQSLGNPSLNRVPLDKFDKFCSAPQGAAALEAALVDHIGALPSAGTQNVETLPGEEEKQGLLTAGADVSVVLPLARKSSE